MQRVFAAKDVGTAVNEDYHRKFERRVFESLARDIKVEEEAVFIATGEKWDRNASETFSVS